MHFQVHFFMDKLLLRYDQLKRIMMKKEKQPVFEKFSSFITQAAGSTPAFIGAISLILIWAVTGPLFHFSEIWQMFINTCTTIITFLMVFLIQKAQNKESLSIQLKLN